MPSDPKLAPHNVQWAAQFTVAAELCKRGYTVSFTMGNATPLADLLVMSPKGAMFSVDVKGQSTKNFWRIKGKPETQNLFYVLCLVHVQSGKSEIFVLTQTETTELMKAYETSGVKYNPQFSGFNWTAPRIHKDGWGKLPR